MNGKLTDAEIDELLRRVEHERRALTTDWAASSIAALIREFRSIKLDFSAAKTRERMAVEARDQARAALGIAKAGQDHTREALAAAQQRAVTAEEAAKDYSEMLDESREREAAMAGQLHVAEKRIDGRGNLVRFAMDELHAAHKRCAGLNATLRAIASIAEKPGADLRLDLAGIAAMARTAAGEAEPDNGEADEAAEMAGGLEDEDGEDEDHDLDAVVAAILGAKAAGLDVTSAEFLPDGRSLVYLRRSENSDG